MNVSVVIPVYNSEGSLEPLIERLRPVLTSAAAYEILLVNDGSRDNSAAVARELAGKFPEVQLIDLSRNYGQHNALLCGIRKARYEVILTLDDDLQHPPEEIPKLLEALGADVDVVYGTPEREQHGIWRDVASVVTKMALQASMGVENARKVSAFRVFRTHLRDAFAEYSGSYVSIDVLLTWGTTRFAALPVKHDPRSAGTSNYTFRKLLTHAINMVTGFSVFPLQLASVVGFFLTGFGVLLLVYVLAGLVVFGRVVPGFAFLACIISIFSGAQMFALGIIGEYLARMHLRMVSKPPYVVRPESETSE
jgi:glycosyltransferase involved in cell wall biosynthesis